MFDNEFSEQIWKAKYQHNNETFEEYCYRISSNIFPDDLSKNQKLFELIFDGYVSFGGRVNSNIGTDNAGLTLFNCFIQSIPKNPDSLTSIMQMVNDYANTLKSEGGVGFCANFFRPENTIIKKIGVTSPGPIKFLEIFDKVSDVITSGSTNKEKSFQGIPTKSSIRKGATMVTMSINHPDIQTFITAKSTPNRLTKMNLSVLVTNEFMIAVKNNADFDLWFPDINFEKYDEEWNGDFNKWKLNDYPIVIYKTVKAIDLWELLLKASFTRNEPGVVFIDNVLKNNNLNYLNGTMLSSNPCQPAWATVLTKNGISTIAETNIGDEIWSEDGWTTVINKGINGIKHVYNYYADKSKYDLNFNYVFSGTEDHYVSSNGKKIKIDDAKEIDIFEGDYDSPLTITSISVLPIQRKSYISTEPVYFITVNNNRHTYWSGGCNVFNCGEIFGHTGIEYINGVETELGDVCCLGSINLTKFYNIETDNFDFVKFNSSIEIMVEALDNVIDISKYPLEQYEYAAKLKRKIGLGFGGVGSILMMKGVRYGSPESIEFLEPIFDFSINRAYLKSVNLVYKKGTFPLYDNELINGGFVKNSKILDDNVKAFIKLGGLRNSAVTAIAPMGSISIIMNNISGGIEPVFATEIIRWNRVESQRVSFEYPNVHKGEWFETDYFKETKIGDEKVLLSKDEKYRIDKNTGLCEKIVIEDYGYKLAKQYGKTEFATATELTIDEHLNILALANKYCDQGISKTINIKNDTTFEEFKNLYGKLHEYGIKGCTTYREGSGIAVLESNSDKKSIKKQQKEFLDAFKDQEGIVQEVRLPDEYPAIGYKLKSENKKWHVHVSFKDKGCTRPFAIFVNTNNPESNVLTFDALDKLEELAVSVGLNNDKIEQVKEKYVNQKNPVKICRMLGFLLRHNTPIHQIVKALDSVEEAIPGTFIFRIKKFLAQFMETHEVEGAVCPDCGEKAIVFKEGCNSCMSCGYSKCG